MYVNEVSALTSIIRRNNNKINSGNCLFLKISNIYPWIYELIKI